MVGQHYRWDFIGLSTDPKPTPTESEKVTDGSTFYCSDTSKLYVFCQGRWYERKALSEGGGGGGDNPAFTYLSDSDANYTESGENLIATWLLPTGTYRLNDDATIGITTGLDGDSNPVNIYYIENQPIVINTTGDTTDTLIVHSAGVDYAGTEPTGELIELTYLGTIFGGATSENDGTIGLVPAPLTGDEDKFLKGDGTWDTPSGGGSITPVQTTGTSTTDVMSQNATTSMVYADAGTNQKVRIADSASATGGGSVAIGRNSKAEALNTTAVGSYTDAKAQSSTAIGYYATAVAEGSVAIGDSSNASANASYTRATAIGGNSSASQKGSIALGAYSRATNVGEMNIGTTQTAFGYNTSNYRLLSGVYDGQGANDAVTVSQVNATIDAINTALSTNIPHIGANS